MATYLYNGHEVRIIGTVNDPRGLSWIAYNETDITEMVFTSDLEEVAA